MSSAAGGPASSSGRWVSVRLQHRQVCFGDGADDEPREDLSVSYAGIVITSYEAGNKVSERWIPIGADPSEEDDEYLIEQLREALLWQAGRPPKAAGE
ncbi:hypothetical protein [Amycolatopsis sp. NPDC059021]|uniref:hypothetical protein n=1 Tax=Amycolatopsis sp. NPDC059021 TaxID=3346704 RepID=UPI003670671C